LSFSVLKKLISNKLKKECAFRPPLNITICLLTLNIHLSNRMPLTISSALSLCAISFALSHGAIAQELPQHQDDPIVVPGSSGNSNTEESPETSAAPEPTTTLLAGLGGLALLFFAMRRK
jgi:hypothetical protein